MICYQETYGEDADGNRGILVWNYELEPDDKDHIEEYVINNYLEYFDGASPNITIPFINPFTEEKVDLEVDLEEWLPRSLK